MIIDNIKYLIFDYGDVLAYPITGHWFITPEFYSIIEKKKLIYQNLIMVFLKLVNIFQQK